MDGLVDGVVEGQVVRVGHGSAEHVVGLVVVDLDGGLLAGQLEQGVRAARFARAVGDFRVEVGRVWAEPAAHEAEEEEEGQAEEGEDGEGVEDEEEGVARLHAVRDAQVAVAEGRAGAVGGELHGQGGLLQRGDVGLRLEHALAARRG